MRGAARDLTIIDRIRAAATASFAHFCLSIPAFNADVLPGLGIDYLHRPDQTALALTVLLATRA